MSKLFLPYPPGIIKPTREVELSHKVGIAGFIGWELIRKGQVIRKSRLQPNLIVDSGMNGIGSTKITTLTTYCGVGTSSTAPAVGQTDLVSPLGRTVNTGGFGDVIASGPNFDYWSYKKTRLFVDAEVNGNLTEVGFFQSSSAGTMFNRQLLKDDLGDPTTIVKTDEDQLKIIFEWHMYANKTVTEQVVNISGTNYDVDNRAADIDGSLWSIMPHALGTWSTRNRLYETNVMPDVLALPAGTSGIASSTAVQSYTSGNFYREVEYTCEPAACNFTTGVGGLCADVVSVSGPVGTFFSTFDPKIPKDNTMRLILMMRYAWARH